MKIYFKSISKRTQNTAMVGMLASLLALSACTKDFEKYNTKNTALTSAQTIAILPTAFGPIEQAIYSNYQTAQNLSADAYGGYMMSPDPFKGGLNNLSYVMVDGWNVNGVQ